jgi:acyl dehydratase
VGQQLYFEDVSQGQEIPALRKHPTRRQLVMWAGASEDFYEIHYDSDFARANQLDNVIVHGRLKAAFLGQLITDWISPAGVLHKLSCRYRGTDPANEDMLLRGVVTGKRVEGQDRCVDLDIWSERPDGTKTTLGAATVVLPSKASA